MSCETGQHMAECRCRGGEGPPPSHTAGERVRRTQLFLRGHWGRAAGVLCTQCSGVKASQRDVHLGAICDGKKRKHLQPRKGFVGETRVDSSKKHCLCRH